VLVPCDSDVAGKTLAELKFRQQYKVTVVGIRRGEERIVSPGPHERLVPNDRLVVLGESVAVERIKQICPAGVPTVSMSTNSS